MFIEIKIRKEKDPYRCLKHTIILNDQNYIFLGTLGPVIETTNYRIKVKIKFDKNEKYEN